MYDKDKVIAELRDLLSLRDEEIIQLKEQIKELTAAPEIEVPSLFKFTQSEEILFKHIYDAKYPISRKTLMSLVYSSMHYVDRPEGNIIDVFICRIRKRLKPFNITIHTMRNRGFYITNEDKQMVVDLLNNL